MRPRPDLVQMFSCFIQLDSQGFQAWLTDRRLQRSMEQRLAGWASEPQRNREPSRSPQPDQPAESQQISDCEAYWSLYWWKLWQQAEAEPAPALAPGRETGLKSRNGIQPGGLALGHLTAYVQEPGYWAALQTARKFTNTNYSVADYFQMAIAELPTLLRHFQPQRGSGLKGFALMVFNSGLRDQLRQRQQVDLCSNWGLLRKISKKRLTLALEMAGVPPGAIATYQLAWFCFNTCYTASPHSKTSQVEAQAWELMVQLYRQQMSQVPEQAPSQQQISPIQLQQWLTQCAQWVRLYLYPPVSSLNAPYPGQEGSQRQDDLREEDLLAAAGGTATEQGIAAMIAQEDWVERTQQLQQMQGVLQTAIAQLDTQSQTILHLYYQAGLTQQQIMTRVQLSQPTVARRLNKARETLLASLVTWSQQALNISIDPNLITSMGTALEQWLVAQASLMAPAIAEVSPPSTVLSDISDQELL